MDRQTQRLWLSWEDYMREWCRRPDLREALPELLEGEDEDFREHIQTIARSEAQQQATSTPGPAGSERERRTLREQGADFSLLPGLIPGQRGTGIRDAATKANLPIL